MINPWEQKKIAGTLFGVVFAYLLAGACYTWFGAVDIAAREQHLQAMSETVWIPRGSQVVHQTMERKVFKRLYTTQYKCPLAPAQYLQEELRQLLAEGWSVEWIRENALEAHKDGIVLTISEIYGSHLQGNLAVDVHFDDVFDRLGI